MIYINRLTKNDIGKSVIYETKYKKQKGVIKSFNDKWVFVVYHCNNDWKNYKNYTAAATDPNDLTF